MFQKHRLKHTAKSKEDLDLPHSTRVARCPDPGIPCSWTRAWRSFGRTMLRQFPLRQAWRQSSTCTHAPSLVGSAPEPAVVPIYCNTSNVVRIDGTSDPVVRTRRLDHPVRISAYDYTKMYLIWSSGQAFEYSWRIDVSVSPAPVMLIPMIRPK